MKVQKYYQAVLQATLSVKQSESQLGGGGKRSILRQIYLVIRATGRSQLVAPGLG